MFETIPFYMPSSDERSIKKIYKAENTEFYICIYVENCNLKYL